MSDDFEGFVDTTPGGYTRDVALRKQLAGRRGPRPGFWEGRHTDAWTGFNMGQDWRVVRGNQVARQGAGGRVGAWVQERLSRRKRGSGLDAEDVAAADEMRQGGPRGYGALASREDFAATDEAVGGNEHWLDPSRPRRARLSEGQADIIDAESWEPGMISGQRGLPRGW